MTQNARNISSSVISQASQLDPSSAKHYEACREISQRRENFNNRSMAASTCDLLWSLLVLRLYNSLPNRVNHGFFGPGSVFQQKD